MPELPVPPLLQAPLTSFLVAAIAAGLIRLIGGPGRGNALAGAAIGIGVLTAWAIHVGAPVISPRHLSGRIPVVVLAGVVAGVILDVGRLGPTLKVPITMVACVGAAWWMVGAPGLSTWQHGLHFKAMILAAAWLVVLLRLGRGFADQRTPLVMLLVGALGLAGVAELIGNAFFAMPALLLAASALAQLAWSWPGARFAFGAAAALGGGGALMATATALWLGTRGTGIGLALLLLGLVFFADGMAERIQAGRGMLRRAAWPLFLGLLCAVPAALAGLIAYLADHAP